MELTGGTPTAADNSNIRGPTATTKMAATAKMASFNNQKYNLYNKLFATHSGLGVYFWGRLSLVQKPAETQNISTG
jgi:hypothetical protein